jgi:hypothetical protein
MSISQQKPAGARDWHALAFVMTQDDGSMCHDQLGTNEHTCRCAVGMHDARESFHEFPSLPTPTVVVSNVPHGRYLQVKSNTCTCSTFFAKPLLFLSSQHMPSTFVLRHSCPARDQHCAFQLSYAGYVKDIICNVAEFCPGTHACMYVFICA